MSILFSERDLLAQREAVWNQYVRSDRSSKALSKEFPNIAAQHAEEATALRKAVESLDILRANAGWIERELQLRLVAKRR